MVRNCVALISWLQLKFVFVFLALKCLKIQTLRDYCPFISGRCRYTERASFYSNVATFEARAGRDDMMVAVVLAGLHNTRDRRRAEGRLISKCKTLLPRGIKIYFNFIWANSSSARFKCCHIWIKWRAFSVTASSTDEGTVVPKRLDFKTF